jgi:hypothetical protein
MHSTHFSVTFWLVISVFDVSSVSPEAPHTSGPSTRTSYAIVLPFLQDPLSGTVSVPVRSQRSSKVHMMALSRSVQNLICIHACRYTDSCIQNDQYCVQHCGLVCSGTPFYVFGRREGYPPRSGLIIGRKVCTVTSPSVKTLSIRNEKRNYEYMQGKRVDGKGLEILYCPSFHFEHCASDVREDNANSTQVSLRTSSVS